MDYAVNPNTGDVVFLVDNKWVPPSQVAQNDKGADKSNPIRFLIILTCLLTESFSP